MPNLDPVACAGSTWNSNYFHSDLRGIHLSAPLEIGSSSADDVVGGLCRGDAGGGTPSEGVWGTPQLARTRSELYNSF